VTGWQPPAPAKVELETLPRSVDPFSSLPSNMRFLWDFAFYRTIPLMTCSPQSNHELTSILFSMGMDSPHLQAAIYTWSAIHRRASGLVSPGEFPISGLRFRSVRLLRGAIDSQPSMAENERLLATALVLAMADVASIDGEALMFRTHLQGAAAIIRQLDKLGQLQRATPSLRYLVRLYNSIQAVVHVCAMSSFTEVPIDKTGDVDGAIDHISGFSTGLVPIFKAINHLHQLEKAPQTPFHCRGTHKGPPLILSSCKSAHEHESQVLLEEIHAMLARRRQQVQLKTSGLPLGIQADLSLLDEAYHHAALIQLWTYGRLHPDQVSLHDCVQRIISCTSALNIAPESCPAVSASPVLFIAGAIAQNETQRDAIRAVLRRLYACFGQGNVKTTEFYLEHLWRSREIREVSSESPDCKWTEIRVSQGE
jgi:hypothetical protein